MAAVAALAGLGIWYAVQATSSPKKAASTTAAEEKENQQNTDDLNKNDPTMNKKVASTTTTTASTSQNLTITVSRPVNNDTLPLSEGIEIRSVISGATSGTCKVTATGPGGRTITKNVSIVAQPSYGSCSVDITGSEVVAGEWQVAMTATSGNSTGKANFKVTVQ